jgi:hypothetical protein
LFHRTKESAREGPGEAKLSTVQLATIEVLDGEKDTTRQATNARVSQTVEARTIEGTDVPKERHGNARAGNGRELRTSIRSGVTKADLVERTNLSPKTGSRSSMAQVMNSQGANL